MSETPVFYAPRETAAILKVSERTVRRWIAEGRLGARRFGRQLRIPEDDLVAFTSGEQAETERSGWSALASDAFADDWDFDEDAAYDDWQSHCAVQQR